MSNDSGNNLNKNADYLISTNKIPLSPGLGVSLAMHGSGAVTDNHGNVLSGHGIVCKDDKKTYLLTDEQLKHISKSMERDRREADNALRGDNTVPILGGMESPLKGTCKALRSKNTRE